MGSAEGVASGQHLGDGLWYSFTRKPSVRSMKRLLLATVSALALVSARPALAADLGRMPVKAAPPAPVRVFSWTGCYLGGHVGWGWGRTRLTDVSTVFLDEGLATIFANSPSVNSDTDESRRRAAWLRLSICRELGRWSRGPILRCRYQRQHRYDIQSNYYHWSDIQHVPLQDRLARRRQPKTWAEVCVRSGSLRQGGRSRVGTDDRRFCSAQSGLEATSWRCRVG